MLSEKLAADSISGVKKNISQSIKYPKSPQSRSELIERITQLEYELLMQKKIQTKLKFNNQ